MDNSRYRELHEKEVNELKSYMEESYNLKRDGRIINESTKNILFVGILLGLSGLIFSSYLIVLSYNMDRHHGQKEIINELQELNKNSRNLDDVIEKYRVQYFIKDALSEKK